MLLPLRVAGDCIPQANSAMGVWDQDASPHYLHHPSAIKLVALVCRGGCEVLQVCRCCRAGTIRNALHGLDA